LPKEKWQDYRIPFRYVTSDYYDAEIATSTDGFTMRFVKKAFAEPQSKFFTDKLFPEQWDDAEAFGIIDDENLRAVIEI
jgi:hypothetical protein